MAQLVEQLIRNQQAAGSSPASSSRLSLDAIRVPGSFFVQSKAHALKAGHLFCSVSLYRELRRTKLRSGLLFTVLHLHLS